MTDAPRAFRHCVWLVFAAMLLSSCCHAETYRNSEYGFSVEVLAGTLTCWSEPPAHDTGVMMLLDADPAACVVPELHRYISVTADYNGLDRSTPQAALDDILAASKEVVASDAPPDLAIPGRPSAVARSESNGGWTTIWVVTQGETRRNPGDQPPGVNYFVVLQTRPERLAGDVSLLRKVLNSIKTFPTE